MKKSTTQFQKYFSRCYRKYYLTDDASGHASLAHHETLTLLQPLVNLKGLTALLTFMVFLVFPTSDIFAQAGAPCNAVRWEKGGHWDADCAVNDNNNAPDPLGIVRCGNSADTQSGVDDNTTYDPSVFEIVPNNCEDPDDNTPVVITPPFTGQKIAWFNFDVRPFAGIYDFQTIATGNYELEWALYYSSTATCSTDGNDLSGDCANLDTLLACGTDFTGWSPQPFITPVFNEATNLYLVVWKKGATNSSNDDFDFTFKARYGCGDLCSLFSAGEATVSCNNDGTYKVIQSLNGTSTSVTVSAPGSLSIVTDPSPLVFTTADAVPNVNNGDVTVTYTEGVPYNITYTPSGDSPYCNEINISGDSPCCTPPMAEAGTTPAEVCISGGAASYMLEATASGGTIMWTTSGDGSFDDNSIEDPTYTAGANDLLNGTVTLTLTVTGSAWCPGPATDMIVLNFVTCECEFELACNNTIRPADTYDGCDASAAPDPLDPPGIVFDTITLVGDDCSVLYEVISSSSGTLCPDGITVTYTYWGWLDENDNGIRDMDETQFSCVENFTVTDLSDPELTCPSNLVLECGSDYITQITDWIATATASDVCDMDVAITTDWDGVQVPDLSCDLSSGLDITFAATDDCGNTATCIRTVYVDDSTPPTITFCPPSVTVECDEDTSPASLGMATATDNCDNDVMVSSSDMITGGACPQEYTITRTWTATDDCGISATCVQTITVDDSTPPTITFCPPSVTVECDEDTSPASLGMATATDNCDNDVMVSSSDMITGGACPQEYTITRTWTATDDCGNSATCEQIITVDDSTPPTITLCPPSVTVECDEDTSPASLGMATATDNCDNDVMVSSSDMITGGACPQEYTITRTWTATDDCGNSATCEQIITVDDSTPPTITFCPPSVTVECDEDTSPASLGIASATDNCDDEVSVSSSDAITDGNCPQEYTIIRTWTATDDCGNSATCEQIITVDDTTPPTITFCPPSVTVECDEDTSPASLGMASATDNCDDDLSVSSSDAITDGNCPQEYTITRTWTATDDCGNSATCEQIITVDDSTPPTITLCPPSVTVECDEDTSPASLGMATATDNCDNDVMVSSSDMITGGACPQEYTITRTWTATDDCGNSATCEQIITVDDSTPPTITFCPPSVTVECDEDTSPASLGMASATDNCDDDLSVSSSDAITDGNCPQEYTITRTWTATDDCGNSATCEQIITVDDTTPPTITFCPPSVTVECDEDTSPASLGMASATDNCDDDLSVSSSDAITDGNCPQEYTITRTWTATDDCGNSATCEQIITVDDSTPPTITLCPPSVTVECDEDTSPASLGMASATDNCDEDVSVSSSDAITDGNCPQAYTITRTWTATDDCGNSATCVQVITVDDSTPPTITFCPPSVTVECDDDTSPASLGMASATDNCTDEVDIQSSDMITDGNCPQAYTITRTWIATDDCGNSATCEQIITVDDSTPPTITFCPPSVTVECDEDTSPASLGMASATDNCDDEVSVSSSDAITDGNCPQAYTITRTWTATDDCGNSATCLQIITVDDSTPPTITFCPPSVTVECDEDTSPASLGMASATDNCTDEVDIQSSDMITDGNCPQEYTITRTWTATDDCGNTATCEQIITVDDSTPPTITFCPPSVTVECDEDTSPASLGMATATDNCDNDVMVSSSDMITGGACPQEYTIIRTWTATDDCGNSATCEQIITVDDSTPPTITFCPPSVTVECDDDTSPASLGMASATDNCDDEVSVSSSDAITDGNCPQEYTITRTWTATDDCGNSATCEQIITVDDSTPPTITFCPVDITIECDESTMPGNTGVASATDNCDSDPIVTHSDIVSAGDDGCPQGYLITRTWSATDACGNSTTCVQVITVEDTTAPAIDCPDDVTIECTASTSPDNTGMASATDNCDPEPMVIFSDVVTPGECPQEMVITRTWTATDACGNSSTCEQVITVDDSTSPTITFCPPSITIECDESTLPGNTGMISATDNCTAEVEMTYNDVTGPGQCPQEYIIVRLWTATDECGNATTCTQVITVDDSMAPMITCPASVTIECDESTDPANTGMASATDNCDPAPEITYSDAITQSQECPQEYTIARTWTTTDACGNGTNCTQTITIVDSTAPVFTFCPPDVTIGCDLSPSPDSNGQPSATDNCDTDPVIEYSDVTIEGGCGSDYIITRTWTASDECGNTSTCQQVISIEDNTPPICAAQDITITEVLDPETGVIHLTAEMINNNSYNGCGGPLSLALSPDLFECSDEGPNEVTLTVTDQCGNSSVCTAMVTLNCIDPCVEVVGWVYLEGAATDPTGLPDSYTVPMRSTLNDLHVLPGQTLEDPFFGDKYSPAGQPYSGAPWFYPGTEGDMFDSGGDPLMGDAGYPETAVDWVLVSLRTDSAGTGGPVCEAAALVHKDGHIEFVEEFDCCDLDLFASYYLVVEHRNHLLVMSHEILPVDLNNSTITYDFRNQQSYLDDPFMFGFSAQLEILPGVYAMIAGNGEQSATGNADTDINISDRVRWEADNGDIGEYRVGDYNLNGDTNFNDRITWERNNDKFTSVPRD